MAEVAICSLVRDGMDYLPSYRRQLASLKTAGGHAWQLHVVEGDSRDASYAFLDDWSKQDPRVHVAREHTGDTSVLEDRAARWARACNACLDLVPADGSHTHVLWLEADLCFPPELLVRLLAHAADVVAPMIWLGGLFYDTWGFRGLDGMKWSNEAPYHSDYRPMSLIRMNSVGSCVLFDRKVLDAGIRFRGTHEQGLLVGVCNDARAAGMQVWADTGTAILHPVERWDEQMWHCSGVEIVGGADGTLLLDAVEARGLGLISNLANLDASALVHAQRLFLANIFRRLETNRLDLEVAGRVYPRRGYDLVVRRVAPPLSWRAGFIKRWALNHLGPDQVRLDRAPAGGAGRRRHQRGFRCGVHIELEGVG